MQYQYINQSESEPVPVKMWIEMWDEPWEPSVNIEQGLSKKRKRENESETEPVPERAVKRRRIG